MPDTPLNPDSPDLPPDHESEAFESSATGDFLGLEADLGLALPSPTVDHGEATTPAAESAPATTWTEGEPPQGSAEALEEASGEAYAEEQVFSDEELWSDEPDPEDPEDDSASWLMDLDGEDELLLQGAALEGDGSDGDQGEEYAHASPGRAWFARLLIAGISIGIGFAGARYLPTSGLLNNSPGDPVPQPGPGPVAKAPAEPGPANPTPPVEVVEPGSPTENPVAVGPELAGAESPEGPSGPVEPTTPEVTAEVTPETAEELIPELAEANPSNPTESPREAWGGGKRSPFVTLTGAGSRPRLTPVSPFIRSTRTPLAALGSEPDPTPLITMAESTTPVTPGESGNPADGGRERRTQVVRVEDMVLLPEELSGRLREASAEEMSGVWMGASIPLDAIESGSRLLTPAVGRVRVLLGGGEVFEGELYAVGKKKVWLETKLGKMALLSWQVDRIEHILTRDGTTALGEDGSQDLAGLERVRVRTPGGVFYGQVIDREGNTVTLITDQGARITLEEAVVGPAGRSATRLVDATGAQEEVQVDPPGPE